ncbi:hypothetical protein Pst134EA_015125 [Puccinia striiformis f. sp. tritici]|uniref:hypothetical protein n=1 Tax=Puccinia striiformis f. sp. tritici TaxID=168172 RepID=UPI002008C4FE|nr:hypothetical protein Pst134EA_015125 [Puccinia striiformis f. sp. tritici]KAH9463039.1 hypothetical protein Pst134EA_015125 [Puccinia striiformis f. sp. tritici]
MSVSICISIFWPALEKSADSSRVCTQIVVHHEYRLLQNLFNATHIKKPMKTNLLTALFSAGNRLSDHGEQDEDMVLDHTTNHLIEDLQNQYNLNDHFGKIAIEAVECPEEEQYARTMYALTSIAQTLEDNPRSTGSQGAEPFNDFVRDRARYFIVKTDIEAYTATHDRNSDCLKNSLPRLTKAKHYPEGYTSTGKSPYRRELGKLTKYVRQQMRDTLMSQILSNKNHKADAAVPTLDELVKLIVIEFLPKHEREKTKTPPPSLGITQWALIDQRLDELRWKSQEFRYKHTEMVIAKDKALFSHGKFWEELEANSDQIRMPTMKEVEDAMARANPPSASQSFPRGT